MRKISNKQSNLTPRATRKRKTKFPKVVKGKKYKDQSRNKLKRNERKNSKD